MVLMASSTPAQKAKLQTPRGSHALRSHGKLSLHVGFDCHLMSLFGVTGNSEPSVPSYLPTIDESGLRWVEFEDAISRVSEIADPVTKLLRGS